MGMTPGVPELFDGMAVDYGRPNFVSLTPARRLVVDVCELANIMDESFFDCCRRVSAQARRHGAHSVARAVCWLTHPDTLSRHGYDAMHFRAEDVARRWLARQEAARLSDSQAGAA